MPKKKISPKKKSRKQTSDSEEPYNSEDDYVEKESESASEIESEETTEDEETASQTGGESDGEEYNEDIEEEAEEEVDEEVEEEADAESEEQVEEEVGEEEIGDEDGEGEVESKTCHMKDLEKDFLVLDEDDSNMYGDMEYRKVPDDERISDNILTYYEMVRILGIRAQQFNYGAVPLVKNLGIMHPAKMAYVELTLKMTPFIIRRNLPGKRYEDWRVDELDQIHKIKEEYFIPENIDWDALLKQATKLNRKK